MPTVLRGLRGFFYRHVLPAAGPWHRKKLAGYARRWGLEQQGFTKEGFFRILADRFRLGQAAGFFIELATGDGLVGSLGLWLETREPGWRVEAWESRPAVLGQLRKNRPQTRVVAGRLTDWSGKDGKAGVTAVTTRSAREAAALCRAIRAGQIRPAWAGIWNPSGRPVWYRRMRSTGYQLELVYERMEFYRDKKIA